MSSPTNIDQSSPTKSLTYDPIERFPYEIWQDCFRLVISDAAHGPLPYLAVSTKWNETIIHDPAFWTTIIIDDGEDQDARIYTFLHLSQPRLIDVEYRGWNGIPGVMDGCASRIQSMVDCAIIYPRQRRSLWAFLETWPKPSHPASYPEMRTVIGEISYTLSRAFLLACPKLNVVRWLNMEMEDELYLSSTVKEANFTRIDHGCLLNIANRTHIQSLGLDCPRWPPLGEDENGTSSQIAAWSADFGSVAVSLGPQLQSLHMRLSLEFFWEFISLLPDLPQLHSLTLIFGYTPTSIREASIFPLHVQHLKALRLHFYFEFDYIGGDNHSMSKYQNSVLKSFARERPLQSLEDLRISLWDHGDVTELGALLHTVINVKSINLSISMILRDILDIISTNHLPKLEVLVVNSPECLDYFDPPNLVDLTVEGGIYQPQRFKIGSQIIKLDVPGEIFNLSDAKSTLETFDLKHRYLKLKSCISPGVIGRFSSLEEISFHGGAARNRMHERKVTNDFLMKLLHNTGSCPRLHTVRFGAYPLWEPLFEIMRRRMTKNIQRITRLSFPVLPHVYLLRCLVKLLGGASTVYTTRNVDEIISRRGSCEYFRACTYCLEAGYIKCLYPYSGRSDPLVCEDKMAIQDLLDFDSTADSGYDGDLYALKDLDTARADSCKLLLHNKTVEITENTLDGATIASWVS